MSLRLAVKQGRLQHTLDELAKKLPDIPGARRWLVRETQKLGCNPVVDTMGNQFFIIPGRNKGPPTAIGSHMDKTRGALGIAAGLEVLRTLKENNVVPKYPIALVNWVRVPGVVCMGSAVWAELDMPISGEGVQCSFQDNPLGAHFELEVERGSQLRTNNRQIGVVVGGHAITWKRVRLTGRAQHTGTTAKHLRSDALLAAAKMISGGSEIAKKQGGLFSVGQMLKVEPNLVNVTANVVEFVYDARHGSEADLKGLVSSVNSMCHLMASTENVGIEITTVTNLPASKFDSECIECIEEATKEFVMLGHRMISGSGHDSCVTSNRCPSAMVFVPDIADADLGFKVLLSSVLKYDQRRQH
ncbi:hypothetical protein DIURU_002377 [Diutina rugosa]|uniref:Peptidase M20 dimerisation domain-containing protein n=1 Tax=Diutina rugosa TaxID=5481 RepID=A0A642UQB0_DIURU|nr:uncharacterized protein DIURU_002377 [Diutina rugosa]KAA8903491.1 hypothetical protein DIURU_002377 [Diutina rugosa]